MRALSHMDAASPGVVTRTTLLSQSFQHHPVPCDSCTQAKTGQRMGRYWQLLPLTSSCLRSTILSATIEGWLAETGDGQATDCPWKGHTVV